MTDSNRCKQTIELVARCNDTAVFLRAHSSGMQFGAEGAPRYFNHALRVSC